MTHEKAHPLWSLTSHELFFVLLPLIFFKVFVLAYLYYSFRMCVSVEIHVPPGHLEARGHLTGAVGSLHPFRLRFLLL